MDTAHFSVAGVSIPFPRVTFQPTNRSARTYAEVVGWGAYTPPQIVSNVELSKTVDTSDEWIRSRTGIVERRFAGAKESTATMAVRAGKAALRAADLNPSKLDLIVVATTTPDYPIPGAAPLVQEALGASDAAALDLNAGCSGFLFGLGLGNGVIAAGTHRNVLVIGAETLSRVMNWQDRGSCVIFGDGAGAAVLQPSTKPTGLVAYRIGTDGYGADLLKLPAGGSRHPATHETIDAREHFVRMNGHEVFKHAVTRMTKVAQMVLADAGLEPEQLSLVIPHQANLRIIQAVARQLKLPEDKFFINIERYGNTSSASIPIALSEAVEAGRVKPGDYLLFVAFGAGFSWGAAIVQWGVSPVLPATSPWKSVLGGLGNREREVKGLARRLGRKLDFTRWFDGLE